MTNTAVCSLPDTGIGLSLVGVSVVLLVMGVLLWRVPRAHRTHVMLAIAAPLAFLASTTQPAEATNTACPEQETRLNRGDLGDWWSSTPSSSPTTSPGLKLGVIVAIASKTFDPVVTGAGLQGSVVAGQSTYSGQLNTAEAADPDQPTIRVSGPSGNETVKMTILSNGTCIDSLGESVSNTTDVYTLPLTCTLTGYFQVTLVAAPAPPPSTSYTVTITGQLDLRVRATGTGLTGSGAEGDNSTYVYSGTITAPSELIEIRGKLGNSLSDESSAYYNHSSLPMSGGTCVDAIGDPLKGENQQVALPVYCTITGNFSLTLDGSV